MLYATPQPFRSFAGSHFLEWKECDSSRSISILSAIGVQSYHYGFSCNIINVCACALIILILELIGLRAEKAKPQ